MNSTTEPAIKLPRVIRSELADPWQYGWREVSEETANGKFQSKRIPLTIEDVLHPQEGDFIVEAPAHDQDCHDLRNALHLQLAGRLGSVVLRNCRVDWGVEGLKAHGPDIAVMENVAAWEPERGTFYVAQLGARPVLVIEVASPSTRSIDFDEKVVEYHRAGVPLYVIADARLVGENRTLHVIGYRTTPDGYVRLPLNEQERLWVEPVRLWIGSVAGQVACFDEHGKRIGTYVDLAQRLEAEAQRADGLAARVRELEAELRSRDNPPS